MFHAFLFLVVFLSKNTPKKGYRYNAKDGSQYGPVTEDQLKGLISNSSLQPSDLVWKEGMKNWIPSSQAPGLFIQTSSAPPPTVPSSSPYQTPQTTSQMMGNTANQDIPNYLWQSIAVTLLCCVPGGVVAIVYASQVDGLKARGDILGAQAASKSAKNWCLASVIIGFIFSLCYVFAGAATEM